MSQPAARVTDLHVCPLVDGVKPHVGGPVTAPGEPTCLIGGLPAARIGDPAMCVGPPDVIVRGSATVLIGGRPAARLGDATAHGGVITTGFVTCLIGDSGSGSGSMLSAVTGGRGFSAARAALIGAAHAGHPFCAICESRPAPAKPAGAPSVSTVTENSAAQRRVLREAAHAGRPFCALCEARRPI